MQVAAHEAYTTDQQQQQHLASTLGNKSPCSAAVWWPLALARSPEVSSAHRFDYFAPSAPLEGRRTRRKRVLLCRAHTNTHKQTQHLRWRVVLSQRSCAAAARSEDARAPANDLRPAAPPSIEIEALASEHANKNARQQKLPIEMMAGRDGATRPLRRPLTAASAQRESIE